MSERFLVIAAHPSDPKLSYAQEYKNRADCDLAYNSENILLVGYIKSRFIWANSQWLNIDMLERNKLNG